MTSSSRRAYQLPLVEAPDLSDLKVTLHSPPPPTADDLMLQLHERMRAVAGRRERKPGELVAPGDELECNIITLVGGKLIPGGTHNRAQFEAKDFLHIPGFIDHILGAETFSAKTFELALPSDYPVTDIAGQDATYYVEILRAVEVESPELDDTELLKSAGLGETLEEAFESVAQDVDQQQAQELLTQASQVALATFATRVKAEIPEAAIDEELQQIWTKNLAPVYEGRPFSDDFVEAARIAYLHDPVMRAEISERILIGLGLGALIEAEGLKPSAEVMNTLLESAAEALSVDVEEVKEGLSGERQELQSVGQVALYQEAVAFVVSKTKFEIIEATPLAEDAH